MKKNGLKKAIRKSFDFPEPVRKTEFLRAQGIPAEKEHRRQFIPLPLRITAAAAACALAIGVWNIGCQPAVGRHDANKSDIITSEEAGVNDITTSGADGVIATTAERPGITDTTQTTAITELTSSASAAITTVRDTSQIPASAATTAMNDISYQTSTSASAVSRPAVRTTVTSAYAGNVTTSANQGPQNVTTTTTIIISDIDKEVAEYERSIAMKKFLASAAAAASLVNIVPTGVQAAYVPPEFDPFYLEFVFPALESGEISPDVNNDGIFDRYDICDFWAYFLGRDTMITPEEKEVVRSRGDVEGDGAVRMNDFVVLEQYYLYKNGIIPEDFNMYSYPDNNGDITMDSYRFTEDLKNTAIEKDLIYQFTADLIEKENISLDFNENGKADEYDLLEYQMYIYSKFSDPFNDDAAKALVPLTDSTWENCDALHSKCFFDSRSEETLFKYYIYNYGFDAATVNYIKFYDHMEELLSAVPDKDAANEMRKGMVLIDLPAAYAATGREIALEADMAEQDEDRQYKLDRIHDENYEADLAAACEEFEQKMLAGQTAPPDVNMDGTITIADYEAVMDYSSDLQAKRNAYNSANLTVSVWEHIDTELDLNGDGVSGDMLDLQIVEYIVTKYTQTTDVDINALLQAYNDAHSGTVSTDVSEAVTAIKQIRYLESITGSSLKRSGDADNNDEIKMNDVVLVMQSIADPGKYQLSEWGEFNADMNNTGDGITVMDALEIQKTLLEIEE